MFFWDMSMSSYELSRSRRYEYMKPAVFLRLRCVSFFISFICFMINDRISRSEPNLHPVPGGGSPRGTNLVDGRQVDKPPLPPEEGGGVS